ncbi:hypothetical protein [Trichlorobacter ammonificans]|uniref:Ribbon-helix-helix protein CopG domain-containing protein n=1 Tax=Trichlorobacter ammonificans TaxID=2916410 RepID=A0ABM9DAC2_9BACT|nr:hypothetical protein [Trichlorobacter ammonificans]CAH2032106.1 protein of unknown function [Trichlorobacter ammonificans]
MKTRRKPVSFRLDPRLIDDIDFFARKSGVSRTAAVEMLLSDGVREVNELICGHAPKCTTKQKGLLS